MGRSTSSIDDGFRSYWAFNYAWIRGGDAGIIGPEDQSCVNQLGLRLRIQLGVGVVLA